jgi:hypothetical protein
MNTDAMLTAKLMLAITQENLGPSYADAERHLVDSLQQASSRVVDLNERATQQRANAALVANFVGLLPKSGVAENAGIYSYTSDRYTLDGHLQTDDERHIPGLISSTVWFSTYVERSGVCVPYYVLGVNSGSGSLLLGKPSHAGIIEGPPALEDKSQRAKGAEAWSHRINDRLQAMPLVVAHLAKDGGMMARRRAKKVIALADSFYSTVSPELIQSAYDPDTKDLKLTPYTKTSFMLPELPESRLEKVEYLSDDQILSFNVIPTINLMAMRFGVSTLLQGYYEPRADLTKPTPTK